MRDQDPFPWAVAALAAAVLVVMGHLTTRSMEAHRARMDSVRFQQADSLAELRQRVRAYRDTVDSLEALVDTLDNSPSWR